MSYIPLKNSFVGIMLIHIIVVVTVVDLEQKVNGVIKYIQADKNSELTLRVDIADDGQTS